MSFDKNALEDVLARQELDAERMERLVGGILRGEWTSAQIAGFLVAIKARGETPAELAAAAKTMRQFASPVRTKSDPDSLVDTCGTGGDGAGLFNVSTAAAFVAAAAGARIAKHGNRALSGASGSADALAELGIPPDLPAEATAEMIDQIGVGFMFAPNHHPAMRHAAPVRKELGVRTMFNLLGPMTNPAGARRQLVGVYAPDLVLPYAETLASAGALRAMVAHGGGIDEISIAGETEIAELKDGAVMRRAVSPEDAGLAPAPLDSLRVSSPEESAAMIRQVLAGEKGPARDMVLMNAAATLIVADVAGDFLDGAQRAAEAVDSGAAQQKLEDAAAFAAR